MKYVLDSDEIRTAIYEYVHKHNTVPDGNYKICFKARRDPGQEQGEFTVELERIEDESPEKKAEGKT